MKFDIYVKLRKGYKTMKTDFRYLFSNFTYSWKCPHWSAPGYHGNCAKSASRFCAHLSDCFLIFIRSRVWSIRGLSSLPWQPAQNENHFPKVWTKSFMVIYHPCPCALAFGKAAKFDIEVRAINRHSTALTQLTCHTHKIYGWMICCQT